jgi:UDP-glucose 4-epimerase
MTSPKLDYAGKKVLITGGLGFIGSNLARRLVEMEARVALVDNLGPDYGGNRRNIAGLEHRLEVHVRDVRDERAMSALIRGQDVLFNLAGQTSHMDSMEDPYTDLEINCRAQLSILEACRKHNPAIKLVFAGTRQVYGRPDRLPVDERHILRPVDINGVHKMAGEWYHILYNNVYGIRGCSLRLTNTFGPGMRVKDARQTFLGLWIRLLVEGKPFEVWDGHQKRDYTYVDDAVQAFLLAGASDAANGRIFNLGGPGVWTLLETAELMIQANGGGRYVVRDYPAERKSIDIGDYYADHGAIRESLGWRPTTPMPEACANTLAYYRRDLKHYV